MCALAEAGGSVWRGLLLTAYLSRREHPLRTYDQGSSGPHMICGLCAFLGPDHFLPSRCNSAMSEE